MDVFIVVEKVFDMVVYLVMCVEVVVGDVVVVVFVIIVWLLFGDMVRFVLGVGMSFGVEVVGRWVVRYLIKGEGVDGMLEDGRDDLVVVGWRM